MRRFHLYLLPVLALVFSCGHLSKELPGKGAEDLWGNRVRLNRGIRDGNPVVIVPFSTSNCGYCMIDGYFTESNYIGNNDLFGGESYHMCLFNPQLDIYAFQKHFGWHSSILTYPPGLHDYHRDGFPTLLAFNKGEQVLRDFYNYAKFDTLKSLLWDSTVHFIPTGELHMATRLIYENGSKMAVYVTSDTSEASEEEKTFADQYKAFTFSTFSTLSEEDKRKHLYIRAGSDLTGLKDLFEGQDIPLKFETYAFELGEYRFTTDTVAFYGCFPNPFNREKYVVLAISGGRPKLFWPSNYLDYLVFSGDRPAWGKRLLYGHFEKTGQNGWQFSEERSFSEVLLENFCIRRCELPEAKEFASFPTPDIGVERHSRTSGSIWNLGSGVCRFPEIASGTDGSCWVTWEQDGNILLGQINPQGDVQTWYAENDESDSYNPKLAVNGNEVWLVYLNNRDQYYHLFAKSFSGGRFSGEVPLTPKGPYDVVTPEVVLDTGGEVVVVWCEWMANQRFLKFRTVKNGIPGEIQNILVAPPLYTQGYTNAWWPSMVRFNGEIWGVWNQHYPAICGVYGGVLTDSARTVTQPSEAMDDREQGAYPDIFTDGKDLYTVWEGNGFNVFYKGENQEVKISKFDRETGRWTPGRVLTLDHVTTLNQTPSGACDAEGNKYVVWSGRNHLSGGSWGIYLSREINGTWNDPVLISDNDETARHPKIIAGKNDQLWISWHSGTGEQMRSRVSCIRTGAVNGTLNN